MASHVIIFMSIYLIQWTKTSLMRTNWICSENVRSSSSPLLVGDSCEKSLGGMFFWSRVIPSGPRAKYIIMGFSWEHSNLRIWVYSWVSLFWLDSVMLALPAQYSQQPKSQKSSCCPMFYKGLYQIGFALNVGPTCLKVQNVWHLTRKQSTQAYEMRNLWTVANSCIDFTCRRS